jgi:transcriptional regulator with XRE-family HTH domain
MSTVGQELKRRREERGITLSEISEATRIVTRFLKAIEEDNFSALPGGIFTRSFIRAYARYVGMDEEEAMALYRQQVRTDESGQEQLEAERQALSDLSSSLPATDKERRRWPGMALAAGFLLALVSALLGPWKLFNDRQPELKKLAARVQAGSAAKTPALTAEGYERAKKSNREAEALLTGGPMSIRIEATTGDSWVRYQIDDEEPRSVMLRPQQGIDLYVQDNIKLLIGNRLTLRLKINSREAIFPPNTPNFRAQVIISRDNLRDFIQ